MNKKRVLLALMLAGFGVFAGAFGLTGCSNKGDSGDTSGIEIDDPDTPLDDGSCKHDDLSQIYHRAAQAAKCTENGTREHWFCDVCDKYFADEEMLIELSLADVTVMATGHEHVDEVAAQTATCLAPGNEAYWHCQDCDTYFADEDLTVETTLADVSINTDEAHGHKLGNLIAATEQVPCEAGVDAHYECELCGAFLNSDKEVCEEDDLIIPAQHSNVQLHAYCDCRKDEGGYYECEDCHKTFSDAEGTVETEIDKDGHRLVHVLSKDSTCTEEGTKEYWYCEGGKKFADADGKTLLNEEEIADLVIAKKEHNLSHTEAKAATCTEAGNVEYWHCSECGKYFSDEACENEITETVIPATGHSYGEWIEEIPATYEEDGVKGHYHCAGCNKDFDAEHNELTNLTIVKMDREYGAWIEEIPATCEKHGTKGHYASSDGRYFDIDKNEITDGIDIPALGHNYVDYEAKVDATCTVDGKEATQKCENCGDIIGGEVIEAIGHNYGEFVYNYETLRYKKTCANDVAHIEVQAAGSEDYPYLAKDAASLKAAIAKGGYIELTDSIETEEIIVISKNVTIDLKGYEIKGTAGRVFTISNATVEIANGDIVTSNYGLVANDSTVTLTNCNISGASYAAAIGNAVKFTMNGGTITGECGIFSDGAKAKQNSEITLNGVTIETEYAGVYCPQVGGVTVISECQITSEVEAAVEVRAGKVTIENSTLTSNNENFAGPKAQSGSSIEGAALGVSQHSTDDAIEVVVTGSTLIGVFAIYEKDVMNATAREDISITLGEGNTLSGCVYSENYGIINDSIDWYYNAEEGVYEYKCVAHGIVIETVEAGSEEHPYLASNADELAAAIVKGGYVQLTADITADVVIAKGAVVTLDLNNYTLSNEASHTIVNNGELTLLNGKVYNGTNGKAALVNNGTANVSGELARDYAADNTYYVIDNNGTMTLNADVYTTPADQFSSLVRNNGGTMVIEGGSYTSGKIAIKNDDSGILTIEGGEFAARQSLQNWGEATINGGEFNGNVTTGLWSKSYTSETIINGGTINTLYVVYYASCNLEVVPVIKVAEDLQVGTPIIQIEGGSSENYVIVESEEEGYTVLTLGKYTAPVEEEYTLVSTAAELEEAVANGGNVKLTADITADVVIAEGTEVTLDLNGYTLTGAGSHTIVNNGTLTLKSGKVYNGTHKKAALVNTGKATVASVELERTYASKAEGLNSYYVIDNNHGELTLIAANVHTTPADTYSSLIRNLEGVLTIESGAYTNGGIAIKNDDNGILTINDGEFAAVQCLQNWSEATINGGKFNGQIVTGSWSADCLGGKTVINGVSYEEEEVYELKLRVMYSESENSDKLPVVEVAEGINASAPVIQLVDGNKDNYEIVESVEDGYVKYELVSNAE